MTWPQEAHADLGLIDDDNTEDLLPNAEMPPTGSRQEPQVEGNRFNHQQEIESYV
ncbi:hypothetical protein [Gordonia phthalatica]|uniref:hypothetical protein n=1 Tax=Gordonia phthalatica TaxID=1136941 RepID=UPI000B1C1A07|nr:hypothetical protein [Gordonia phthalatica]